MRVGIDIGGTKTAALIVGADGGIRHELLLPTGYGPDAVIETAVGAVHQLASLAGINAVQFESIGVGIPGIVDAATGRVDHAVNLGLDGLELGSLLATQLGSSVHVENDVNAAALGVFHLLDDPAMHSMAYLNLGTGLAAGLVLGGTLWRGSRGTAGEIGHIPVDPSGPPCACGQRGCLELMASGSAIARHWPSDHPRPAEALFAAAAAGDDRAIAVWKRLIENIAAAIRVLILTVDVDVVVVGGGMSALGSPLVEAVGVVLDSWAAESPFLDSLQIASRVRLMPEGHAAAAVGAALGGRLAGSNG